MEAIVKAVFTTIIAGGVIIAAFAFAYILIFVVVLAGVGWLAYLYFTKQGMFAEHDFFN